MRGPDDWPPRVVWLIDRADNVILGSVICQSEMDLSALEYALKHVEHVGYEVHLFLGQLLP